MPLEAANDNQIQNISSQSNGGEILTDLEGGLDAPVVEQVESTVTGLAALFPGVFLGPNELVSFLRNKRVPEQRAAVNNNGVLLKDRA